MIEEFNGLSFLMFEEFDRSFLIRAYLIERECVYLPYNNNLTDGTEVKCQEKENRKQPFLQLMRKRNLKIVKALLFIQVELLQ